MKRAVMSVAGAVLVFGAVGVHAQQRVRGPGDQLGNSGGRGGASIGRNPRNPFSTRDSGTRGLSGGSGRGGADGVTDALDNMVERLSRSAAGTERLYWQYNTVRAQIRTWNAILRDGNVYLLGNDPGQRATGPQVIEYIAQQCRTRGVAPSRPLVSEIMRRVKAASDYNKRTVLVITLPNLYRQQAALCRQLGIPRPY